MTNLFAALSPVLVVLLGGLGWLYRHERERRQAAESQLSERKRKAYTMLLDVFFDVLKATKTGKAPSEKSLATRMYDANVELVLYGSDTVLRVYQDFLRTSREGRTDLRLFGALVAAIRRDMGHLRSKVGADEVLRQFVNDFDTPEVQQRLKAGGR